MSIQLETGPVVVGIDGTASAARAVRWAAALAGRRGVELRLAHAFDLPGRTSGEHTGDVHVRELMRGSGKRWLAAARALALETEPGLDVEVLGIDGDAVDLLVEQSATASLLCSAPVVSAASPVSCSGPRRSRSPVGLGARWSWRAAPTSRRQADRSSWAWPPARPATRPSRSRSASPRRPAPTSWRCTTGRARCRHQSPMSWTGGKRSTRTCGSPSRPESAGRPTRCWHRHPTHSSSSARGVAARSAVCCSVRRASACCTTRVPGRGRAARDRLARRDRRPGLGHVWLAVPGACHPAGGPRRVRRSLWIATLPIRSRARDPGAGWRSTTARSRASACRLLTPAWAVRRTGRTRSASRSVRGRWPVGTSAGSRRR